MIKTYSELIKLPTFEERYRYLRVPGRIGEETFGSNSYIRNRFLKSDQWKSIRNNVIIRDYGYDLGIEDREIQGCIIVHHMNPITLYEQECRYYKQSRLVPYQAYFELFLKCLLPFVTSFSTGKYRSVSVPEVL